MRLAEQNIQEVVVRHIHLHHPDVLVTCAPGNATNPRQGVKNKRMGYLKGFPDLFVAFPARGFHGLFIELKTDTGRVKPEQEAIINKLTDLGYKAIICRGAHVAIMEIDAYLKK